MVALLGWPPPRFQLQQGPSNMVPPPPAPVLLALEVAMASQYWYCLGFPPFLAVSLTQPTVQSLNQKIWDGLCFLLESETTHLAKMQGQSIPGRGNAIILWTE